MNSNIDCEYGAILVDTCIFINYKSKFEKGLLSKLSQFKDSNIAYLLPNIIKCEINNYLENEVKNTITQLKKLLDDAGDHIFFNENDLDTAKSILIEKNVTDEISAKRINRFIEKTGALELECGEFISVSSLLQKYFHNEPPFAETGKKKNEFPDAIVLMATEEWAKINDVKVLAVSKDNDWNRYIEKSDNIDYTNNLSDALSKFNQATIPFSFLSRLIDMLEKEDFEALNFLDEIQKSVENHFYGFTPDIKADALNYWELAGTNGCLTNFEIFDTNFKIVENNKDYIVIEISADITVEVESEFLLYHYDTIDRDNVYMGSTQRTIEEEFTSEILVTIEGDLTGKLSELNIANVEIVNPITTIDFGTLEPDYSDYE